MNLKNKNINTKNVIYGIIAIVCILIMILFTFGDKRITNKNVSIKNKGDKYFYSGEYDKALEEYQKIKSSKDSKVLALKNLDIAKVYWALDDTKSCNKYLDLAAREDGKDKEVLNNIVFTKFMIGKLDEALKEGEKALKANPDHRELIKTMMTIYMAKGYNDKAKKILSTYKVDTKSSYDMADYSRLLMITGNFDKGFTYLKGAWEIDSDDGNMYNVLSQMSLYNKDKLINCIKKLQKNNPEDLAYKMWLAKIYSLNPDTVGESEKLLYELKRKNLKGNEIDLIEISNLENQNKYEEASKLIDKIIKKDDYKIYNHSSWFYLRQNDLDKALEYCKKSIEKNKEYCDNYAFLMPEILKHIKGKEKVAKSYFWTGIFKEPYNYNALSNAGKYHWYVLQDDKKALEYFKLAKDIILDEPEIRYNIALLYFNKNKNKEAIDELKKCIKLKGDSIKYHRTLGTVYLTIGKGDEGIKEIRFAYKYDPDDILTLNNAGCYYIMYTDDFGRGYYNLKSAMISIKNSTDEYTKKVIKENYDKVEEIIKKFESGNSNDYVKIPDFRLLY